MHRVLASTQADTAPEAQDNARDLERRIGQGRVVPMRVRPEIVIGITGHRPARLYRLSSAEEIRRIDEFIENHVRDIAASLAKDYPDCTFAVMSALGDGADRIVARHLLDALRAQHPRLVVPLPVELYRETFGQAPQPLLRPGAAAT